jgi:hypothetical protein
VNPPAVEAYHRLLEDRTIAQESVDMLKEGQRANRLSFGERPLSIALRPQLVERVKYDAAVVASRTIFGALGALERALLRDPQLRAELDLLPEEERLALADPGSRYSSPSSRLDGFFSDELRFVEYNAESPAGMAYSDNLTGVFEKLPVMRAFRKRFKLRGLPVRARQLAAMLRAFREWGKAKTPVIAIVDWGGLPTLPEFEMFREYFLSRGIKCLICDPRELEFSRQRLYANATPVNLVYRRVLTSELLSRADQTKALGEAYLAGAACVVNTFRAKLLHKKMSLALLSDDRYAPIYTEEQRCAIARHVPWTRKVREGRSTRNGTEISDLSEYLAQHREELLLQPNDEYGGKGVVLGWTVRQPEWEQALRVALTQSYVVQEAVPIPRQTFPVALEGVQYLDLAMDMNPYLFGGRVSGCLARLSSSALLNVTAGAGSVVPTYIVEGQA